MRKPSRCEHGFSLLESLIVIAIMMAMLGMAVVQSFGSMETYRVNAAMDVVIGQLRVARQLAISQRRTVTVTFNTAANPQTITYTLVPNAGDISIPPPVTVSINPQVQFVGLGGEPDTPMAFGTCSGQYGICVGGLEGGPAIMEFTSLGQFTDVTGVSTLNGTIFLAVPNKLWTARAVTIMGSTGRVRSYTFVGGTGASAWTE